MVVFLLIKYVKMLHCNMKNNKKINTKNNEKTLFLMENGVFFEKKVDFFEIYDTIVT